MNDSGECASKPMKRNASPTVRGYSFQVGAGISLMLDYVKEFSHIKIESASDDIELTLNDGMKIYAQAKCVMQMDDQRNASSDLKKALNAFKDDLEENPNATKFIYITNIHNPLSSESKDAFTFGSIHNFSDLNADDQKNIEEKIGDSNFPHSKFQVQILWFFGEKNEKFRKIEEKIEKFLISADISAGYSSRLLDDWRCLFTDNGSDKPEKDDGKELSKEYVIYSLIALLIESNTITDENVRAVSGYEDFDDILMEFSKIINERICDYEFITKIVGDYLTKLQSSNNNNYIYEFIEKEWQNYEIQFLYLSDEVKRKALTKILIFLVIRRHRIIMKATEAANL